MSWHSWDIHSWSARFSLALWCLCVCDSHSYCHSYGGFGVSVAGSHGFIRTNCLCSAASQSASTHPHQYLLPPVGCPSHLLALPSLNQRSWSRRVSVWPVMSHIWRRFIVCSRCCVDPGLLTGQQQLKCRIKSKVFLISLFMKAPSCCYPSCFVTSSAYGHWWKTIYVHRQQGVSGSLALQVFYV